MMENYPLKEEKDYIVKALEKGLTILEAFDTTNTEYSVLEISKKLKINRTTAFRLMKTLELKGFLEKNPESSKYGLGLKLLELGNLVTYNMDLQKYASPLLHELAQQLSLTVHLVVRQGSEAIYIDKEDPQDAVITYSRVGKRLPLYCTAVGKVLLSDLKPSQIKELFNEMKLTKFTNNTIDNLDDLIKEVELTKINGYAIDDEELLEGMSCIAAPIRNYKSEIIAACSVTGTDKQFLNSKKEFIIPQLINTANKISQKMGCKNTF
ncbi:MAG: IclR family transcriptional regulator, regulon repressor [Clostridia bacterium]|nr:transcriptional regulator, IclR family [Clostridiales bacterium]MDK2986047.1 IclR family transcriptional regulator, regulon repressor [Clostridia bacterium]